MKYFIVLFLVLRITSITFTQEEWAPIGAKWWYIETNFVHTFIWPHESVSELIINSKNCKKIKRLSPWTANEDFFYTHQDDNKVYFTNPGDTVFRLVFDFDKKPGESWMAEIYPDTFLCTVDSVTQKLFGNQSIQVQHVQVFDPKTGFSFWTEIYRNIGCLHTFQIPYPTDLTAEVWYFMGCYEDSLHGLMTILPVPGSDCETLSTPAIERNDKTLQFQILPNPSLSETTLTYRLLPAVPGEVRLFDALGRQVAKYAISQEGTLTIPGLPAGLYVASLLSEGRVLRTERLVKL